MSFIWVACRNMGQGFLTGAEMTQRQLHCQSPRQPRWQLTKAGDLEHKTAEPAGSSISWNAFSRWLCWPWLLLGTSAGLWFSQTGLGNSESFLSSFYCFYNVGEGGTQWIRSVSGTSWSCFELFTSCLKLKIFQFSRSSKLSCRTECFIFLLEYPVVSPLCK